MGCRLYALTDFPIIIAGFHLGDFFNTLITSSSIPYPRLVSGSISVSFPFLVMMNFITTLYAPTGAPFVTGTVVFKFSARKFFQSALPSGNSASLVNIKSSMWLPFGSKASVISLPVFRLF